MANKKDQKKKKKKWTKTQTRFYLTNFIISYLNLTLTVFTFNKLQAAWCTLGPIKKGEMLCFPCCCKSHRQQSSQPSACPACCREVAFHTLIVFTKQIIHIKGKNKRRMRAKCMRESEYKSEGKKECEWFHPHLPSPSQGYIHLKDGGTSGKLLCNWHFAHQQASKKSV